MCGDSQAQLSEILLLIFSLEFSPSLYIVLTGANRIPPLMEISHISENKEIVIIDGIGGPSTGSVVGVSNVDIARSLAAPVVFIGKPGIGSAIDDTILAINFMQQRGIKNIALIYNKIESSELVSVKHYVSKRLAELLPNVPVLGFIVNHTSMYDETKHHSLLKICQWFNSQLFD